MQFRDTRPSEKQLPVRLEKSQRGIDASDAAPVGGSKGSSSASGLVVLSVPYVEDVLK